MSEILNKYAEKNKKKTPEKSIENKYSANNKKVSEKSVENNDIKTDTNKSSNLKSNNKIENAVTKSNNSKINSSNNNKIDNSRSDNSHNNNNSNNNKVNINTNEMIKNTSTTINLISFGENIESIVNNIDDVTKFLNYISSEKHVIDELKGGGLMALIINILTNTYLNKIKPENHVIYYPSSNYSAGHIFINNKWQNWTINDITEKIIKVISAILTEILKIHKDHIPPEIKNIINKAILKHDQTCSHSGKRDRKKMRADIRNFLPQNMEDVRKTYLKYTRTKTKMIDLYEIINETRTECDELIKKNIMMVEDLCDLSNKYEELLDNHSTLLEKFDELSNNHATLLKKYDHK